jgi:anthranilate synthase/aminodeoxychorismate synthase-like glutamine amidotransferase
VVFNDQLDLSDVDRYDKIVLSPGPRLPKDAGVMMELIEKYHKTKPILGVCLGFQGLVEFFGGSLYNQQAVKHGVQTRLHANNQSKLFKNTANEFQVGLYHSWAANKNDFPKTLEISGTNEEDVIMAFEHTSLPIAGVQFHPESILSEFGKKIVENFIFNFH